MNSARWSRRPMTYDMIRRIRRRATIEQPAWRVRVFDAEGKLTRESRFESHQSAFDYYDSLKTDDLGTVLLQKRKAGEARFENVYRHEKGRPLR